MICKSRRLVTGAACFPPPFWLHTMELECRSGHHGWPPSQSASLSAVLYSIRVYLHSLIEQSHIRVSIKKKIIADSCYKIRIIYLWSLLINANLHRILMGVHPNVFYIFLSVSSSNTGQNNTSFLKHVYMVPVFIHP